MIKHDIIVKYQNIKSLKPTEKIEIIKLAEQMTSLVRTVQSLCQKDFMSLSVSHTVMNIIDEGSQKIGLVTHVSGNNLIIVKDNNSQKILLKHSSELVNIFDDGGLTDSDKIFLEIYLSDPHIFLLVNLGLLD